MMACIIRIHDKNLNGKSVGQLTVHPTGSQLVGREVEQLDWKLTGQMGCWSVGWEVAR